MHPQWTKSKIQYYFKLYLPYLFLLYLYLISSKLDKISRISRGQKQMIIRPSSHNIPERRTHNVKITYMQPLATVIFKPSRITLGLFFSPYFLYARRTQTACCLRVHTVDCCGKNFCLRSVKFIALSVSRIPE